MVLNKTGIFLATNYPGSEHPWSEVVKACDSVAVKDDCGNLWCGDKPKWALLGEFDGGKVKVRWEQDRDGCLVLIRGYFIGKEGKYRLTDFVCYEGPFALIKD